MGNQSLLKSFYFGMGQTLTPTAAVSGFGETIPFWGVRHRSLHVIGSLNYWGNDANGGNYM